MHCSCKLIQLHIPSSWIKLFRTVHQQAHGNLFFFLPNFSGFLTFLTLLYLLVYLQSCCVLWLLSSPFSQCPSAFKLSQCLSNYSLQRVFPGAPNLPFSQLQNSTLHPTQSRFSSSALQTSSPCVTAQTITPHWELLSWTSPTSCSSLQQGSKKPSQNHTELAKNPSRLWGQENKTFPRKSGRG